MGFAFLPFAFFTMLWGGVGIGLPIFLPKGENKGLIQLSLVLTASTCYLFWLCTYMAQMNPLIGPKLKQNTLLMLAQEWPSLLIFGGADHIFRKTHFK